jgi:anaerobic magnesium-protoporphyrin IX monomethyl ester cyclase
LHREHGVEVFNFADENPTSSRRMWKRFLLALIAEKVNVTLVGSTRAGDIVRDQDLLHLYKQAGVERFLMGMENPDQDVLDKIRKGSSNSIDAQAIRLMRRHGMLSLATWVVGFDEERDADYWRGLKQLIAYDPDQIQMLYVTPHRWTPFFSEAAHRRVIQLDQTKWDYKHQVLATRHVPPWRVFLWVKGMELVMQMRPRALLRLLTLSGARLRRAQRWYYQMGRRVWFHEVLGFFFRDRRVKHGPSVEQFWGATLAHEEEALARPSAGRRRQLLPRQAPPPSG